jgi:hypothetical protein
MSPRIQWDFTVGIWRVSVVAATTLWVGRVRCAACTLCSHAHAHTLSLSHALNTLSSFAMHAFITCGAICCSFHATHVWFECAVDDDDGYCASDYSPASAIVPPLTAAEAVRDTHSQRARRAPRSLPALALTLRVVFCRASQATLSGYKLRSVTAVIRHGDRTASGVFFDPQVRFCVCWCACVAPATRMRHSRVTLCSAVRRRRAHVRVDGLVV